MSVKKEEKYENYNYAGLMARSTARGWRARLSKSWQPLLDPVSLKTELEGRKELSDIRSELERRLSALRKRS